MLFINEKKESVMVRLDDKTEKTGYSWIIVNPGKEIDLRKDLGENFGFTAKEEVKEEGIENKKSEDGKYSKTDLIDSKKADQIKILKELGVNEEDIKKLKTEDKRVAMILKLQDGKDNK